MIQSPLPPLADDGGDEMPSAQSNSAFVARLNKSIQQAENRGTKTLADLRKALMIPIPESYKLDEEILQRKVSFRVFAGLLIEIQLLAGEAMLLNQPSDCIPIRHEEAIRIAFNAVMTQWLGEHPQEAGLVSPDDDETVLIQFDL